MLPPGRENKDVSKKKTKQFGKRAEEKGDISYQENKTKEQILLGSGRFQHQNANSYTENSVVALELSDELPD